LRVDPWGRVLLTLLRSGVADGTLSSESAPNGSWVFDNNGLVGEAYASTGCSAFIALLRIDEPKPQFFRIKLTPEEKVLVFSGIGETPSIWKELPLTGWDVPTVKNMLEDLAHLIRAAQQGRPGDLFVGGEWNRISRRRLWGQPPKDIQLLRAPCKSAGKIATFLQSVYNQQGSDLNCAL